MICALIYRPPGYNKNFLDEFSEFLSVVVPSADRILIMGDFNIHVCCPGKPMTREFLNLVDSFNLFQCVSGPTHDRGHTLDLVFSLGITIENICVEEMAISDHMPIRFNVTSTTNDGHQPPSFLSRVITTSTSSVFSTAFTELALHIEPTILSAVGPDELVDSFNNVCSEILDNVAPFKMRCQKVKKRPWLNDVTRNLRRVCRLAEHKWQKDKLQISYDILRESLSNYQNAVRAARSSYFSRIISHNANNPKVLFSTIDKVLSPSINYFPFPSKDLCDSFLKYFIDKVVLIRSNIVPVGNVVADIINPSRCLSKFASITLVELEKIIMHLKPTTSFYDVLPSRLFKEVVDTIGPNILLIINSSLYQGIVPSGFKHAVIEPVLKKHNLDSHELKNYRPISKLPFNE